MSFGDYLSTGINTLTLGAFGSRPPEVVSFVVHSDGTKSEEPTFESTTAYRQQRNLGVAFASLSTVGAVTGIQTLRSAAVAAEAGTMMNRVFGSGIGAMGLRASQVGVAALGIAGVLGTAMVANNVEMPVTNWLADRFKTSEVLQVYYDEQGNLLGEEIVDRSDYESEKKEALKAVDPQDQLLPEYERDN